MDAKQLITRADALRAKYKLLESVPGSGYHDNDRNLARPDLFLAPQKNGLSRASERVVFFADYPGEEVLFVGEDARRALAAIQSWEKKARKIDQLSLTGTERKLLTRIVPRLAIEPLDNHELLCVRLDQWNDVLHALYAEGLGLSGLPLEE